MHPATHFAYAIAVGYASIVPIFPPLWWDGLIYVCYVPISSCSSTDNRKLRLDVAVRWLTSRLVPTAASVSGYLIADLSGLLLLLLDCRLGCWPRCIFGCKGATVDTSLRGALCPGAAAWAGKGHNRAALSRDLYGGGRCHHHRRRGQEIHRFVGDIDLRRSIRLRCRYAHW